MCLLQNRWEKSLFFYCLKLSNLFQVDMYARAHGEFFYEIEDFPRFAKIWRKTKQQKAVLKNFSNASVCFWFQ